MSETNEVRAAFGEGAEGAPGDESAARAEESHAPVSEEPSTEAVAEPSAEAVEESVSEPGTEPVETQDEDSQSIDDDADVADAVAGDDDEADDDKADEADDDEADDDEADDGADEAEGAADGDGADDDAAGSAAGPRPSRRARRAEDLEREGEVAADFLERLLDIADLDGDIDVDVDGDRASVAIVDSEDGRVPRRLVGPDGKVLDALQELTRLAVQAETGERSRLMLDVAGHRAERRRAVIEKAKEAIAAVRDSGEAQNMEPMTAFERKAVHDEVLAAGLSSESEGLEPRRFVVVLPA